MKDIKFRVWDKVSEKMYDVGMLDFITGHIVCSEKDNYKELVNDSSEMVVLMQYTGLKDRNGDEIYEGDIIEYLYKDNFGIIGTIEYSSDSYHIVVEKEYGDLYGFNLKIGIIGNIHENPELIEV